MTSELWNRFGQKKPEYYKRTDSTRTASDNSSLPMISGLGQGGGGLFGNQPKAFLIGVFRHGFEMTTGAGTIPRQHFHFSQCEPSFERVVYEPGFCGIVENLLQASGGSGSIGGADRGEP